VASVTDPSPQFSPSRPLGLWIAGVLALAAVGWWYAGHDRAGPDATGTGSATAARGSPAAAAAAAPALRVSDDGGGLVVVHVAGAVRRPGVYRLRAGERVDDAVHRAGGPTARADLGGLNLAAKVEDGRQVLVPVRTPTARAGVAAPAAAGSSAVPGADAPPINVNTATPDELDQLDGIGPAMAARIIEYRDAHGGFGSVEELGQVSGIGEKRLAALRDRVTV
jgi:competence protein ComEA